MITIITQMISCASMLIPLEVVTYAAVDRLERMLLSSFGTPQPEKRLEELSFPRIAEKFQLVPFIQMENTLQLLINRTITM